MKLSVSGATARMTSRRSTKASDLTAKPPTKHAQLRPSDRFAQRTSTRVKRVKDRP